MTDPRDQSARELQALQRVVATGGRALDLDAVLGRALEQALAVAGADAGSIYLRDEMRRSYRCAHARAADGMWPPSVDLAGMDDRVPADRVLIDLREAREPAHPARAAVLARGFSHALVLRLSVESERVGFVALVFRRAPALAESTLHTLDAIAAFEAVAIASARAHRQLEQRARLASTLRDVAQQLLERDAALEPILVNAALAIVRGDRGFIARIYDRTPGEPWLRIDYATGADARLVGVEQPATTPYLRETLLTTDPTVVEDTAVLDPATLVGEMAQRQGTASFVLVTMRERGRPVGQLFVGSPEPRAWDPAELEAIRLLSSLAAQALTHAERRAEERAVHARIAAILEHLPMVTSVVDRGGEIIHMNRAARAFADRMGAAGQDWRANLAQLTILDRDGQPMASADQPIMRAFCGETVTREVTIVSPAGRRLHAVAVAAPLDVADGRVASVLASFQDVTELRELANAKDRFLSIASHELRSPITSLRATTSLLQMDPAALTDESRRAVLLSRVQRQVDRLSTLIERLLDTTRLNAGELPLELADCDLVPLCRDVLDGQRLSDRDHTYVLEGDASVVGRWDAARLEQVLTNLVSNACRYAPAGTAITVRPRVEGERALVDVTDRGPGIAAEQLDKLFTPFFRGAAAARHKGGLGLGLYISREIVRRHGGQLRVDSEPGRTTFTAELPRAPK